MTEIADFANILQKFVRRSSYSAGQLARLTAIPKPTILSWLDGRVKHPRSYDDIVKLAERLHLNQAETIQLLTAAGFGEMAVRAGLTARQEAEQGDTAVYNPPFQAIPALPYFVGRQELLKQLEVTLLAASTVRHCCLVGMAGAGKTALAAQVAYRLRTHFADGVLWANVHRSDPMTILLAFARAYGEDVSHYQDLESRGQVTRQILADKQVLIILDDVWHGQDLFSLMPPSTGTTAVLVTTRRQDLFATVGMHRLVVGPFDTEQQVSLQLFGHFLEAQTVSSSEEALQKMAELLGHLPLAITIAASRLAYEPSWSPDAFLERLKLTQLQLSELAFADQSVQISFSASFALLDEELQLFFALTGVFSGNAFSPEAVAAVAQIPLKNAEDKLRKLYALSLCQLARTELKKVRYRLHPLLSKYAEETAVALGITRKAHHRLIKYFVDYGEKNRHSRTLLAAESNFIPVILALAKKYRLEDDYERCLSAFSPVLGLPPQKNKR